MLSPSPLTKNAARQTACAENPFLFLVGCARSGTTLLQRILDAHPLIAMTPETHWIPRFYRKRVGLEADGVVKPALIDALLANRHFNKMQIGREALEELLETQPHYSQFVSAIFDLYGRAQGKNFVGDKTPGYERRLPTLHALWPRAKFIHLIRDGRDVCLSMLNWNKAARSAGRFACWQDDPICTAAFWWKWHVQLGRQYARELPRPLYLEIHYETVVARSEEMCRAIANFLGVAFDERMLRFEQGRTIDDPALDAKHAWRPITAGLRDWRTQMSAADVEKFEACTGDVLDELGYERGCAAPSEDACERARRIRDAFASDVQSRGHALPESW